ncbi:hypothetical protein [Serratia entomophila]|uniref:hypothetical protein n=1 Tax=Serratia entomophila TaxID=42906 RepID=UPI0021BB75F5|nr:hypothetical protein [Serratia entomophila]
MDVGFMRPLLVWRRYWIDEGYVMSRFKGTPGPWVATVRNNNDLMTQFYGVLIGSVCVDIPTDSPKIDARLIAAAPELLDALINARKELEGYEQELAGEAYSNPVINAVINKALG